MQIVYQCILFFILGTLIYIGHIRITKIEKFCEVLRLAIYKQLIKAYNTASIVGGNYMERVFGIGMELLDKISRTQATPICKAGVKIAESFLTGHKFFVTGSGHSHTVAEEFYGRAGGLAFVVPILTSELTLTEHPTKSTMLERLPGYATILIDLYRVQKDDVILIASNSGINAYPVEMALEAKKRGATVIAITNITHSKAVQPRHASGKKLMDIADIVIDNCGVVNDSALQLDGLEAFMCPTSSIANACIVQAMSIECAKHILAQGVRPPVFMSANGMDSAEVNDKYFNRYTRLY